MTLEGRVTYDYDPMTISVRAMNTQMYVMSFYTENIAYADMPGYQRKTPMVTTFAEHLGTHGIDSMTDTSVGRITKTQQPLDFALNTTGYFQKLQPDGRIAMTRDGRFHLDKDGILRSNENMPVLSRSGTPIQFPFVPDSLDRIKMKRDGWIEILDPKTGETQRVAQMGVAMEDGTLKDNAEVLQGQVEASNVFLHEEFVGMVAPKRSFQANRQMFLTHSSVLGRLIQEMGRAQ